MDGQTLRTGIIQQTMTTQLAYDYAFNAELEALAMAPKAPYIIAAEQISGYEQYWNRANDPYLPYLPYKPISVGSTFLPPPQRQTAEPAIQALSVARQQAAEDMRAVLGMYAPSMGEPGQERSGTAIRSQKIEGDQSTFHFPANLAWSIRAVGLQIVDILPKLYARPTTLRQVGKDGSVSDDPRQSDGCRTPRGDGRASAQPGQLRCGRGQRAWRTRRSGRWLPSASANWAGCCLKQMLPMIADLWVAQLDIPYSEDLAARLKTVVPPEALAATKDKNPQTAVAALQNQVQQATQALQQMQQQLQEATQIAEVSKQQLVLTEQRNATLETRLADKQADNQLEAQKNQRDYEVEMRKLQLDEQRFLLEVQKAQQPQNEQAE